MANSTHPSGKSSTPGATEAFESFFRSRVRGSVVLMVRTIAALAIADDLGRSW